MTAAGKITAKNVVRGDGIMVTNIRTVVVSGGEVHKADPSRTKVKDASPALVIANAPGTPRTIVARLEDGRLVNIEAFGHNTFWLSSTGIPAEDAMPMEEPSAAAIQEDENRCPACGTLDDGGDLPHCPTPTDPTPAPADDDTDDMTMIMTVRMVVSRKTWEREYGGTPAETRALVRDDLPALLREALAAHPRRYLLDDVSAQAVSFVDDVRSAVARRFAAAMDSDAQSHRERAYLAEAAASAVAAWPPLAEACV